MVLTAGQRRQSAPQVVGVRGPCGPDCQLCQVTGNLQLDHCADTSDAAPGLCRCMLMSEDPSLGFKAGES